MSVLFTRVSPASRAAGPGTEGPFKYAVNTLTSFYVTQFCDHVSRCLWCQVLFQVFNKC